MKATNALATFLSFVAYAGNRLLEPAASLVVFPLQVLFVLDKIEACESFDCLWWQFAVYVAGSEFVVDRVVFDAESLDEQSEREVVVEI